MILKLLVVVPCGQAKIWKKYPRKGPTKAKDAYTGSPFKVNRAFAERFADRWIILSAKYGLIDPDFIIPEEYNVTFKKPSTDPVKVDVLKRQSHEKTLDDYDAVIALGGKDYFSIVREVFKNVSRVFVPAEGLIQGKGMHLIKSLMNLQKTEMLERIAGSYE